MSQLLRFWLREDLRSLRSGKNPKFEPCVGCVRLRQASAQIVNRPLKFKVAGALCAAHPKLSALRRRQKQLIWPALK